MFKKGREGLFADCWQAPITILIMSSCALQA